MQVARARSNAADSEPSNSYWRCPKDAEPNPEPGDNKGAKISGGHRYRIEAGQQKSSGHKLDQRCNKIIKLLFLIYFLKYVLDIETILKL